MNKTNGMPDMRNAQVSSGGSVSEHTTAPEPPASGSLSLHAAALADAGVLGEGAVVATEHFVPLLERNHGLADGLHVPRGAATPHTHLRAPGTRGPWGEPCAAGPS